MSEKDPSDHEQAEHDELHLDQDSIRDLDADDDADDVRGGAPCPAGTCGGSK